MTKPKTKAKGKPKRAGNLRSLFVDEYMIDRNGTEAAKRAGYAPKSAGVTACQLLKDPKICAEINKRSAEQSQRLRITADRVMQEYEALALLDPLDLFRPDGSMKPLAEIPEAARRAIGGLELRELADLETPNGPVSVTLRKVKLIDKRGALDSIAKILGMMRDKVDVTIKASAEDVEKAINSELQKFGL